MPCEPTKMNYKKEFLKLAKKYGIVVCFDRATQGDEFVTRDWDGHDTVINIHLKDIRNEKDFAGALHELAHGVYESEEFLDDNQNRYHFGYGKSNCTMFVLKTEYNAWKHATYLCPITWTDGMNDEYLLSISSYIDAWEIRWKSKLNKKFKTYITNLDNPTFKI